MILARVRTGTLVLSGCFTAISFLVTSLAESYTRRAQYWLEIAHRMQSHPNPTVQSSLLGAEFSVSGHANDNLELAGWLADLSQHWILPISFVLLATSMVCHFYLQKRPRTVQPSALSATIRQVLTDLDSMNQTVVAGQAELEKVAAERQKLETLLTLNPQQLAAIDRAMKQDQRSKRRWDLIGYAIGVIGIAVAIYQIAKT